MKKVILALVALAFAFAISSCCDQSYCPGNRKCDMKGERGDRGYQRGDKNGQRGDETPYRWDRQDEQAPQSGQERQHRRW